MKELKGAIYDMAEGAATWLDAKRAENNHRRNHYRQAMRVQKKLALFNFATAVSLLANLSYVQVPVGCAVIGVCCIAGGLYLLLSKKVAIITEVAMELD